VEGALLQKITEMLDTSGDARNVDIDVRQPGRHALHFLLALGLSGVEFKKVDLGSRF